MHLEIFTTSGKWSTRYCISVPSFKISLQRLSFEHRYRLRSAKIPLLWELNNFTQKILGNNCNRCFTCEMLLSPSNRLRIWLPAKLNFFIIFLSLHNLFWAEITAFYMLILQNNFLQYAFWAATGTARVQLFQMYGSRLLRRDVLCIHTTLMNSARLKAFLLRLRAIVSLHMSAEWTCNLPGWENTV